MRDLQWRRRRFVIAVGGAALAFALALVISGVSAGFRNEAARTVAAFDADAWLVPESVAGPFTTRAPLPAALAALAGEADGVERASPVAIFVHTSGVTDPVDVNVIGVVPGGVGDIAASEGRSVRGRGEAVTDASLGLQVGDELLIGEQAFEVVGVVHGITFFAGVPTAVISLPDAQALGFAGEPLANAIVTKGSPTATPTGLAVRTNDEVLADLTRPLRNASETISFIMILLWFVATSLIGTLIYLSALERTRDFAVLKATGTGTTELVGGLVLQALLLSLAAAAIAAGAAVLLAPIVPMRAEVPGVAFALLPALAAVAGGTASLFAVRRAVTVDPAIAFGGP